MIGVFLSGCFFGALIGSLATVAWFVVGVSRRWID